MTSQAALDVSGVGVGIGGAPTVGVIVVWITRLIESVA